MTRSVLLAGGNGFVGKHLERCLLDHEFDVRIYGNSKNQDMSSHELVQGLPKCDVIVHLAAKSFVPDSFVNPKSIYEKNFLVTLNLLEKARLERSQFIFISSYVYGKPKYLPIDELHERSSLNPYMQSKILCEDLCFSYNRDFNMPLTVFRPFNVYGPGQKEVFFISKLISNLKNKVIQLENPHPKRDFVYISDLVEAIALVIGKASVSKEIYNLGSGVAYTIGDVANYVKMISGSMSTISFSNSIRKGEISETCANIEKAKSDLGWLPKVSLFEGIQRIIFSDERTTET